MILLDFFPLRFLNAELLLVVENLYNVALLIFWLLLPPLVKSKTEGNQSMTINFDTFSSSKPCWQSLETQLQHWWARARGASRMMRYLKWPLRVLNMIDQVTFGKKKWLHPAKPQTKEMRKGRQVALGWESIKPRVVSASKACIWRMSLVQAF